MGGGFFGGAGFLSPMKREKEEADVQISVARPLQVITNLLLRLRDISKF